MSWTVQGLWVLLTSSAALAAITASERNDFGIIGIIGIILWLTGFVIEIIADEQKRRFKMDPSNQNSFITEDYGVGHNTQTILEKLFYG